MVLSKIKVRIDLMVEIIMNMIEFTHMDEDNAAFEIHK